MLYEYKAKMVNVVDGDTMDFEVDLGFKIMHKIRVRLKDIDTPEIYHPRCQEELEHGRAAKSYVIDNFLQEDGRLLTFKDKTGKYGRYLAEFIIIRDGKQIVLSESLKSEGFEKKESYAKR